MINFILINRTILTANHFKLIQQWKIKNEGLILNFDDLAEIDGINKKIVENLREFCASKIANDTENSDNHNQAIIEHAAYVSDPDDFRNDFIDHGNNSIIYDERIPPIDLTIQNDNRNYMNDTNLKHGKPIKLQMEPKLDWKIESFTSIHQEANGISVARFSANNSDWNELKIDTWTQYKTETFGVKNLCQICEQLAIIVEQLPQSDIYICDDHIKAQRFHKSVTPKKLAGIVQINQQCGILMALLHKKGRISNENDGSNVFFMGYQSVGQLFNLLVGNEPISTQSTIKNLLRGNFCSETLKPFKSFTIDVSDEIKHAYHKSYAAEREGLGRSMLIGLTFIHLGILKAKTMPSKKT